MRNLLGQGLTTYVQKFKKEKMDALILLKQLEDPTKFGVETLLTHKKAKT